MFQSFHAAAPLLDWAIPVGAGRPSFERAPVMEHGGPTECGQSQSIGGPDVPKYPYATYIPGWVARQLGAADGPGDERMRISIPLISHVSRL
ncbi:hypothetical protein LY76DRAFT_374327 [Colletotrichum caudatum]|nr:hypothetical protein LY76DRAFT_374327 [Colletotrichum caudatum]